MADRMLTDIPHVMLSSLTLEEEEKETIIPSEILSAVSSVIII